MARPKKQGTALCELERRALVELTGSRVTPHGLVMRAEIVLASADGETRTSIARRVGVSMPTVGKRRSRFLENGLVGLYGEHRPRRPRSHDDEKVADLLQTVLEHAADHGTHWSVKSAAQASGISKSSVQRYSQACGSGISLKRRSADAPFGAQKSLLHGSKDSLMITTNAPGLSYGQPPPIPCLRRSKRYVNLVVGQDASAYFYAVHRNS